MCPICSQMSSIESLADGSERCGNSNCQAAVRRCDNDVNYAACHRGVAASDSETLCDYCRLNVVIPDLSVDENLNLWRNLESAKQRVLTVIESIGLPVTETSELSPSLRFEFKSDHVENVSTGHADGLITINLREADSVEREKTRVEFCEPQRTLVGHFRHELGHFYWELLVKPQRLEEFRTLYGDEREPDYATAQQSYYNSGPKPNWRQEFVSAYASMHPWEDFAETFHMYVDVETILQTAEHFGIPRHPTRELKSMLASYTELGIFVNELNRDMGLIDLVPEVFTPKVIEKLEFVHQFRNELST